MTRINQFARSTFDLFGIVKRIVDAKAISVIGRAVGRDRAPDHSEHEGDGEDKLFHLQSEVVHSARAGLSARVEIAYRAADHGEHKSEGQ